MKKNGGADFSFTSGGGGNGWTGGGTGRSRFDSVQPTNAAKYMKRFLSPVSYDRDPVRYRIFIWSEATLYMSNIYIHVTLPQTISRNTQLSLNFGKVVVLNNQIDDAVFL